MDADDGAKTPLLKRRVGRRTALAGTLAAVSVAVTYAAVGDPLGLLRSDGVSSQTEAGTNDAAALDSEKVRLSHLLRRAGFGASSEEYDRYASMGLDATLDELVSYSNVDDAEALRLAEQAPAGAEGRNPALWWLIRMANTKRPLQEKMTLFWHGLLTSQISVVKDPQAMLAQNELFRAHAMDPFPTVLRGVTKDPAMMVYLDVAGSMKAAPNENYARELMELFSLGEGNYSEQDVREAARAFTGWAVPRTRGDPGVTLQAPIFRPLQFDGGSKTFLGKTGNFRPEDVVDIIVDQPASARFITRRLFATFIYPDPSDADLQPFVDVYDRSERSIGAVVEAMLRSEVFYSPRAYRSIVKSPVEYAIGAVKALGLQASMGQVVAAGGRPGVRAGGGLLGAMGQIPFEPPNVAGWPGGASWLNSATIFARLNFLNQLTGGAPPNPDLRQARQRRLGQPSPALGALGTAREALDYYLPLVLDANIPDASRQVLLDYAGGADATLSPEKLRGLVYLILGSPQFHLA